MRIVCFGIMILVVIDRVGFVVIMFRYNNGEVFIIKMVYIKEFFWLLILFLNVSILFNVGNIIIIGIGIDLIFLEVIVCKLGFIVLNYWRSVLFLFI